MFVSLLTGGRVNIQAYISPLKNKKLMKFFAYNKLPPNTFAVVVVEMGKRNEF